MARNILLFKIGILFGMHACIISGAQYGDSCVELFTHCDYEGGWCDPFTDKCSCEGDDVVFSLRTGMCQKEKTLGSHCYYDKDCTSPNSRCWTDQKCRCQDGFYDTNEKIFPGGECKPNAKVGETCSSIDTCWIDAKTWAECNAGVCACQFRQYPSNGTCVYDKSFNTTGCNIDGFDSCMFSAQCVDDTCKCKPGYKHLKPDDRLCSAEVGTRAYCDQDSDCSFDNSECIDNACICRAGFYTYLSNEFGYCKPKRDWVPIGPYVFDVGTNGFSVGWSKPVANYKVECYFVEFTDGNLPDQTVKKTIHVVYQASNFIQAQHTKHEFRSLTPGVEYSVGVMMSASKEACQRKRLPKPTLTDPHKDKRDFSEMIYVKQRTMPGKPGPLQLDKCDLENEDGYIRLHWNPPEGQYDGFRVIITSASNTGAMMISAYYTQPFSEHRITQDEGRFNVSIWSCVDVKDGSTKLMCSERYFTMVSLHQQLPSAPRNVKCTSSGRSYSTEIVLEWEEPEIGGNTITAYELDAFELYRYALKVAKNGQNATQIVPDKTAVFHHSKRQAILSDFIPNQRYVFKLYAKTDAGRSIMPAIFNRSLNRTTTNDYFGRWANLPVCSDTGDDKELLGPSEVKLTTTNTGHIHVLWKKNWRTDHHTGYILKLFNENGECEIYVEVKCIQGCLLETFADVWPTSDKTMSKCHVYATMNVSHSEMRSYKGLTYNPEYIPAAGKNYSVQVTSVEAFKTGNSKTAYLEPQLDVCSQCKPLSSSEDLLDMACSQTTALLRRFKVDKRRASTGLVTLKIRKLKMYRQEPKTQSPKEAVLAGMTGCKCEMLDQSRPKLVAMLRVDGDSNVVTRLVKFTKPVKKSLKKLQKKCDKKANKSTKKQKPSKPGKEQKPGKSRKQRKPGKRGKSSGKSRNSKS